MKLENKLINSYIFIFYKQSLNQNKMLKITTKTIYVNQVKISLQNKKSMTSRQQRKHNQFVTPYNQNFYHHIQDYRRSQQKGFQHDKMQFIFRRNLTLFGIEYTQKRKVKYDVSPRFKIQLDDGWYCNITDNGLKRQQTILTVHGAPGDHMQWAGLETEMDGKCRWVNITIPGFDQQDQRRGTYTGSAAHFAQMIVRVIKKLSLGKIIYCGHSLGSIYGAYFIEKYPQFVQGYINVTGIVNTWYTGLLGFFYKSIAQWQFNYPQGRRMVFQMSQQQRKIQHVRFINANKQFYFGLATFPDLTITQYFAYIKLFDSLDNGISQNYRKNMDHKLLRVLFFGRKDPLHIQQLTDQSCYYFCFDPHSYTNSAEFRKILKLAEAQLKQKMWLSYGVGNFKVEEIQQYFAYHFPDTGHNAHKRRPSEMSKVIRVYVDCLAILNKYKELAATKI